MRRAMFLGLSALFLTAAPIVSQEQFGPVRWEAPSVHMPVLARTTTATLPGGPFARAAFEPPTQSAEGRDTATLILAGLGGWAGGWVGGYVVGLGLGGWNPFDGHVDSNGLWIPGMPIGLGAGQMVGIPLAVHKANRSRGDLGTSMLVAAALSVLGTTMLWTDDLDTFYEDGGPILLSIPVAQIVSSIIIERRTSR